MTDRLTVTALGSCRIVNPMRLASSTGLVVLNNADVYGYVHTPDEVLQLFDYIEGTDLPETIVSYLAGSRTMPRRTRRSEPDIYLIEIASLNTIRFHGWNLQLNYFAERLRIFPDLYRGFLDAPAEGQRDRRTINLAHSPNFAMLPSNDRRVLVDAHSVRLAREDLRNGVLALVARLAKPILFVTHLDIADASGKFIESRGQISAWMAELAEEFDIAVFDPTDHVKHFGIEAALADNGQSRTHYSAAFEWALANLLVEEMPRAMSLSGKSGVASDVTVGARRFDFRVDSGTARDSALKLIRDGDLPGATALARAAIAENPPCPRAMSILAQAALRAGDASLALDFALKTCASDAGETSAIVVAAKAFTKLHKFELAAEQWEQMSSHRPGSVWPLVEAARCRLRAKSPEAALDLITKSLRREPDDVLSLAVKAEALYMLGRWGELVEVAVALASGAANAALATLQSMIATNEVRGISRIADAIRLSPTRCEAPDDLVDKLRVAADEATASEQWETAGECLRAVLSFRPGDEHATKALARLLQSWTEEAARFSKSGAVEDAIAAYGVVLKIDPLHSVALRQAAMLAEKQSDWNLAADLWIRGSEKASDPVLLARMARVAELADREEEALKLYRRALDLDPGHAKAAASQKSLTRRLAKKGRSLESQGDVAAATKVAAAVLQVSPGDPVCAKILRRQSGRVATLLREARNIGDAVRQESLAHELLRLDPTRFEALRVLSTACMKRGDFLEAAHFLRRLVVVQTDVPAHWTKLSRCLRMLKKHEEAEAAAREALMRDPVNRAALKTLADLDSLAFKAREIDSRGQLEASDAGHKERLST